MISPADFVAALDSVGVSMFTGVPDSLLKQFGTHVMAALPAQQHIIAANEGSAVGIAMGHHMATGEVAAVYLQNSGFGNTVNPLLSLADPEVYGIPMLVIIGWRGEPGVKDEPQHVKQGRVMTALLDACEIPWSILPDESVAARSVVADAVRTAVEGATPVVLLVSTNTFDQATVSVDGQDQSHLPSREEALIALADAVGQGALIVSTTGMLSRELFEYRKRAGQSADGDFLTVGGMGHASAIALGVALAEPGRDVWCLDGDGALLMHAGGLAVVAKTAPANFHHVVFNNGVHDSVGGQPTAVDVVDVPALAIAMGYGHAESTADPALLGDVVGRMRTHAGPSLLELRVRPGNRGDIGRPTRSPARARAAFMRAVATPAT